MTRLQKLALRFFLQQYPDERLAALYCHAKDGKLAFFSCCCFVGAATANHKLRGMCRFTNEGNAHYRAARSMPGALEAERAYAALGFTGKTRRRLIIPLIRAEFWRRDRAAGAGLLRRGLGLVQVD